MPPIGKSRKSGMKRTGGLGSLVKTVVVWKAVQLDLFDQDTWELLHQLKPWQESEEG